MMSWYDIKRSVEEFTGLSMDALHVHAGMIVLILAALVIRRPIASPWPWLAVLAATLVNEWTDLAYETWPDRAMQYGESLRDVWNTMLLPTALLILARVRPALFSRRISAAGKEDPSA